MIRVALALWLCCVPAVQEGKDSGDPYRKGADWLVSRQDKSGAWMQALPQGGQVPSVGFTGLAVAALAGGPCREACAEAIGRGTDWLVSKQSEDGSFGEGPAGAFLKSYSTAIALMVLAEVDAKKHEKQIRGAQAYLKNNQVREGIHKGGSGYGDSAPDKEGIKVKEYANMSTTGFAAEGLKRSGLPQDDEFWKLVGEFCRKVQNSTEVNRDEKWIAVLKEKGLSIGDDGGLYYAPIADPKEASKAGTKKLADREVILSYGSMTYEGIKTYLYAGFSKDSPEVKAAIDWVRKNYTVEGHPGFPFEEGKRDHLTGLYYYYVSMAKALDAYGESPLKTFDGTEHPWANEMVTQLQKLQQKDGSWKNENPRWYESVPELCTSYALLAWNAARRNVK